MNEHELEHEDRPTWCVHCGSFDEYAVGECFEEDRTARRFDSRVVENQTRLLNEIFGFEDVRP